MDKEFNKEAERIKSKMLNDSWKEYLKTADKNNVGVMAGIYAHDNEKNFSEIKSALYHGFIEGGKFKNENPIKKDGLQEHIDEMAKRWDEKLPELLSDIITEKDKEIKILTAMVATLENGLCRMLTRFERDFPDVKNGGCSAYDESKEILLRIERVENKDKKTDELQLPPW